MTAKPDRISHSGRRGESAAQGVGSGRLPLEPVPPFSCPVAGLRPAVSTWSTMVSMDTPESVPERNQYEREQERLLNIVRFLMTEAGMSIRQLETIIGVSNGARRRVFAGDVTLSVPMLLEMLDALKIRWDDFFLLAYFDPAATREEDVEARVKKALRRVRQQKQPKPDLRSALGFKRDRVED